MKTITCCHQTSYAIKKRLLSRKSKSSGIELLLATPVKPEYPGSPSLVSCGATVIIKAIPRRSGSNSSNSSSGSSSCGAGGTSTRGSSSGGILARANSWSSTSSSNSTSSGSSGSDGLLLPFDDDSGGLFQPHVMHMLDCMNDDEFVYIVLSYGGDLFSRLLSYGGKGLPDEEARSFFYQIVKVRGEHQQKKEDGGVADIL